MDVKKLDGSCQRDILKLSVMLTFVTKYFAVPFPTMHAQKL